MPELLSIFLNVLAPVFAIVLVGYIAGPRLDLNARTVSRLAYFVLVPPFIFNVFSAADIEAGLAARMILFILVVTALSATVAFLIARGLGRSPEMIGAYVLIAAFGNVGNFGFPIIQFALGDEALVDAAVYFLAVSTFGFVVGVIAATLTKSGERGNVLGALLAVFKTPGVLAVIPALLFNAFGWQLPLFAGRAVELLAGALIPVMLLGLGIQLATMGRLRLDLDMAASSATRLLGGPALALALAPVFGLEGIARGAGVLQAAMPAAILASLIALEHDLLPDFVTTTVLFSTLASAVTLTIVVAIV